jgi:hypothetical protein
MQNTSSSKDGAIALLKLYHLVPGLLTILVCGLLIVNLVKTNFIYIILTLYLVSMWPVWIKCWIIGEYEGQYIQTTTKGYNDDVTVHIQ